MKKFLKVLTSMTIVLFIFSMISIPVFAQGMTKFYGVAYTPIVYDFNDPSTWYNTIKATPIITDVILKDVVGITYVYNRRIDNAIFEIDEIIIPVRELNDNESETQESSDNETVIQEPDRTIPNTLAKSPVIIENYYAGTWVEMLNADGVSSNNELTDPALKPWGWDSDELFTLKNRTPMTLTEPGTYVFWRNAEYSYPVYAITIEGDGTPNSTTKYLGKSQDTLTYQYEDIISNVRLGNIEEKHYQYDIKVENYYSQLGDVSIIADERNNVGEEENIIPHVLCKSPAKISDLAGNAAVWVEQLDFKGTLRDTSDPALGFFVKDRYYDGTTALNMTLTEAGTYVFFNDDGSGSRNASVVVTIENDEITTPPKNPMVYNASKVFLEKEIGGKKAVELIR